MLEVGRPHLHEVVSAKQHLDTFDTREVSILPCIYQLAQDEEVDRRSHQGSLDAMS